MPTEQFSALWTVSLGSCCFWHDANASGIDTEDQVYAVSAVAAAPTTVNMCTHLNLSFLPKKLHVTAVH